MKGIGTALICGLVVLGCADADHSIAKRKQSNDTTQLAGEDSGPWIAGDAQFFTALRAANAEEIHAGNEALTKVLSAEVKALANEMVVSRTALAARATELEAANAARAARASGGKHESNADAQEPRDTSARSSFGRLSADSAPKGRDIDRVYLDGVVRRCRATLRLMANGMKGAETTDVRYFIQQSAPIVIEELDHAESLRRTIQ